MIIQKPSPNFNDRNGQDIDFIILHYTGMKTAQDALERLCDPDAEVSAHYTVDEDGSVYQHVEENMRAWHAGKGQWNDCHDLNSASIGIEIVNPGHEFGYRQFTDAQIETVVHLCRAIQKRYDIKFVLAHSDIAPIRKEDPGELFPWQYLAECGVGQWPSVSNEDALKSKTIDTTRALDDFGYSVENKEKTLIAFQRHFVPEAFECGHQDAEINALTQSRLYALLAGHLILSK